MRISDWSSDVCSSDLPGFVWRPFGVPIKTVQFEYALEHQPTGFARDIQHHLVAQQLLAVLFQQLVHELAELVDLQRFIVAKHETADEVPRGCLDRTRVESGERASSREYPGVD